MLKQKVVAALLTGLFWCGCDHPRNPNACANQPAPACGPGMYCANDGQTSECLKIPPSPVDCLQERWPGACTAAPRDAGADADEAVDGATDSRFPVDTLPVADATPDVDSRGPDTMSPTEGGPGCTDQCTLGHKRCLGGVAECVMVGACTDWGLAQGCTGAQMCEASGNSASCVCPTTCAIGDLRCSEAGIHECVLQDGCVGWGPAKPWRIETVERGGAQQAAYPSITVSGGRIHVLYRARNASNALYAVKHAERSSAGSWQAADLQAGTPDIASEPLLRSDSGGTLQAAYLLLGSSVRLRAGLKAGPAGWMAEDISPATTPQTNIVNLDLSVRGGTVALAYDGEGSSAVGYVSWLRTKPVASGTWSVSPIASSSEMGSIYPAAAIDASGKVFLSFFSTKFRNLTFSDRVQNEPLESDADPSATGYASRIVFDSNGGVHVLAVGPSLRHFRRPAGQSTWQKTTASSERASELRLVSDDMGGVHAVTGDGLAVRYAHKPSTGAWSVSRVPHAEFGAVKSPDVAVDAQRVHVVYELGAGGIEYATMCR